MLRSRGVFSRKREGWGARTSTPASLDIPKAPPPLAHVKENNSQTESLCLHRLCFCMTHRQTVLGRLGFVTSTFPDQNMQECVAQLTNVLR